ncbi:hypothetical protein HAX54_039935, partial [Datura stramonium]|nr:hypothetical protein [Datura stramonium]
PHVEIVSAAALSSTHTFTSLSRSSQNANQRPYQFNNPETWVCHHYGTKGHIKGDCRKMHIRVIHSSSQRNNAPTPVVANDALARTNDIIPKACGNIIANVGNGGKA